MTNDLALKFPAHSRQVSAVRHRMAAWLDDAGLDDDTVANLVLAVSEAVSNAVEHAYQDDRTTGTVELRAELLPDRSVCVAVVDHGRWLPRTAALSSRGRGLLLMRENVDQVIVDRTSTGTTVTLRVTHYPVRVPRQAPRGSIGHEVLVHEVSGRVEVVVRGNVPAHAAPTLRRTLTTLARGGSVPLAIDLADFDGDTGGLVPALLAVAEAVRAAGNKLTVRPPRSHAAHAAVAGLAPVLEIRNWRPTRPSGGG